MAGSHLVLAMVAFLGTYTVYNLKNLFHLVTLAKARMREEAQKDHFFDPKQVVVDLSALVTVDSKVVQAALSDEKFKTPISGKIIAALQQITDPKWQVQYLARKTRKASYDDLLTIQQALEEYKIPYKTCFRMNPVRKLRPGDTLGYRYTLCRHQDFKRHVMTKMKQKSPVITR